MSGIRTSIELQDNFSDVLDRIVQSANMAVTTIGNLSQTMNTNISTPSLEDMRNEIDSTIAAVDALQPKLQDTTAPTISVGVAQSQVGASSLDVSSVQNYTEQIEQMRQMLAQVSHVQQSINSYSQKIDVIPKDEEKKIQSVNADIERMNQMLNMIENNPFDLPTEAVEQEIVSLTNKIRQAAQEQLHLQDILSHMDIEIENPPPTETQPKPVTVPVHWESDNLEVFTSTGVDRFQQEVASANRMLEELSTTQDSIAKQAYNTNIFPPEAFQNLNSLAVRIDMVRDRIQQIENNPLNVGTDEANAGLEQLRSQLSGMIQTQYRLNQAMKDMDVTGANIEYMRLSQTVSQTERSIRDNVNAQGAFNQEIQEGNTHANTLMNSIKGMVAAYATVQTVGNILNISDELTMTTARLDMMNDGVRSTDELVKMVYASAQDARGGFSEMADVVARFGNNAKDAFGSTEEVVAFSNLVQKQMTIAGASTEESSNAMLQLSQALGSGVLRGDELNSIFEQAPNLIQNIADYLEVPIGEIREMAADGELSANVVKSAIFAAADDINAKFESMPMTWGQIWTSFTNTAIMAFQPVLQRLNDMANSEAFQNFVNGAIQALAVIANVVLNIFSLIGSVAGFISDNWSIISPIIYGVVAALAVYAAYLAITEGLELATAAAKGVLAAAEFIHVAALAAQTRATISATAAQMGLNGAMYACPIVWIIIMIIALIAIIYAVCSAIAEMTGIANTGFGVIVGAVSVVVAVVKNLVIGLLNTLITWVVNFYNMVANFAAAFGILFDNPVAAIKAVMLSLFNYIVGIVAKAASILDAVFGSNLADAVSQFQGKIQAEIDATIQGAGGTAAETLNPADYTLDRVDYGDAFNAGAAWGDNAMETISNFSLADVLGQTEIPNVDDYTSGFDDAIQGAIGGDLGNIADNTGSIADDMGITEEDLKYMRDIAEQEAVNRFTTAEISIDMSGMQNSINSGDDIDGFMTKLTDSVNEAVENMPEGVHE